MKISFIALTLLSTAATTFAATTKCVEPQFELLLNNKHEIVKEVNKFESKNQHNKISVSSVKVITICEVNDKGIQKIDLEYIYSAGGDLYSCSAEVEYKNKKQIQVSSLCEI